MKLGTVSVDGDQRVAIADGAEHAVVLQAGLTMADLIAVVIGAGDADIPLSEAMGHVFGYTIINDLTSPTMRTQDTFHYRAIHPKQDGSAGIEYVDTWVTYSTTRCMGLMASALPGRPRLGFSRKTAQVAAP